MSLYLLYLWKRIRDSKIKTKLTFYLVAVVLLCSITVGSVSYINTRDTLIENTQETAISALKQVGNQLDGEIRDFQNTSYTFSQREGVQKIFELNEKEENLFQHNSNQSELIRNLVLLNSVHTFSEYIVMQNFAEQVYVYNKNELGEKLDRVSAQEIIESVAEIANKDEIIQWVKLDNQVYFIRKVMRAGTNQVIGQMIIAVSEDLFICGDDNNKFVENDNLVISSPDGEIYKNNATNISEKKQKEYQKYRDNKYYYYTSIDDVNGEKYMVIPLKTVKYQWHVLCFVPYAQIIEKANRIIFQVIITTILLLVIGLVAAYLIYRIMFRNLKIIESGMLEYEHGNYTQVLSPLGYDELGLLILQFNHMGMKINELNQLAINEQKEKQNMQYMIREAQINPHFLYNTLGSLKWLAYEKGQDELVQLTDALISLLRFTVKNTNKVIELRDEIEYIKNYNYFQKARYEEAFEDIYEITETAYEFKIWGYVLQPFVENCILHGLDISERDGRIWIRGYVENGNLILEIEDNGSGMSKEKIDEMYKKIEEGEMVNYNGFNGIGVINIILRMRYMYGNAFKYKIESESGKGTKVTLVVPDMRLVDEKDSDSGR